jgi:hypothetical protein
MARPAYSTNLWSEQGLNGSVPFYIPPLLTIVIREICVYSRGSNGDRIRFHDNNNNSTFFYYAHMSTLASSVIVTEERRWVREWQGDHEHGFTIETEGEALWDINVSGYLLSTLG